MNDRNLARGLFLLAISLAFGLEALRYPFGGVSRPGPGFFPLMVRSRFIARVPLEFNYKNIAIILASLCGFALISRHANMIVGILFMVFCASFAGTAKYSVVRNLKVSAGLIAIAFAFQKLLGFNLPLY